MPEDEALLRDALERVRALNAALRRRRARTRSSCSTAAGSGTRRRGAGWAGSGSAASSRNSTGCSGATAARAIASCSADPSSLPRIRFVITLDADTQMPRDTAGRLVGHAGPSAQPAAVRSGDRAGGRGLRRAAAAGQLPPDGGHAFAVRRAAGGLGGHRPVLDGGLRRLHGPLRPRQLHRQGDLRRRRLRGGDRRDLPREPDPQPRPDRGQLRALRPAQRHRAVRRLPRPLPRLRPPRAPLGPRRLAAPALAGPRACRRPDGRAPNPLPALERWKLFDNLRRSLVPPALVVLLVLGWTVLPGLALALDGDGPGRPGAAARSSGPWASWSAASRTGRSLALLKSWRESIPATGRPGRSWRSSFLADQARLAVDAIARTLVRLFVTRRKLLEWETAASTEQRLGTGLRRFRRGHVAGAGAGRRGRRARRGRCGRPRSGRRCRSWPPGSSRRWSPSGSAGPGRTPSCC